MHLGFDIARCLAFGTHHVSPLCAHGRLEVDDDETGNADGLHVDLYGDECGEWFSEKCEGAEVNLGKFPPVSSCCPRSLPQADCFGVMTQERCAAACLGFRFSLLFQTGITLQFCGVSGTDIQRNVLRRRHESVDHSLPCTGTC